ESGILEQHITDDAALVAFLGQPTDDAASFTVELSSQDEDEFVVRSVEKRTGHARTRHVRRSMLQANEYRQLVRVHEQLVNAVGTPSFAIRLGEHGDTAISFDELRTKVMDLAGRNVEINRFKGLGEMNAEQLRETTMDPATRTLARVTMEDAA